MLAAQHDDNDIVVFINKEYLKSNIIDTVYIFKL